jgi:hypothetical protein
VHANNIEDRIRPGTPARTRAAHRVRHRRVLRNSVAWSLLILKDPASSLLDQHADPRSAINPCSDPKSRIGFVDQKGLTFVIKNVLLYVEAHFEYLFIGA